MTLVILTPVLYVSCGDDDVSPSDGGGGAPGAAPGVAPRWQEMRIQTDCEAAIGTIPCTNGMAELTVGNSGSVSGGAQIPPEQLNELNTSLNSVATLDTVSAATNDVPPALTCEPQADPSGIPINAMASLVLLDGRVVPILDANMDLGQLCYLGTRADAEALIQRIRALLRQQAQTGTQTSTDTMTGSGTSTDTGSNTNTGTSTMTDTGTMTGTSTSTSV